MIKKDVTYGDWRIVRHNDSKMEVYKNGELSPKSAPALREIAEEVGLEVNPDWRTSQLGRNVIKAVETASKGENADPQEGETMSLIEKLRTDFIVETEDLVYYWTGTGYSDPDLFIENIKAQMTNSQLEILEVLKYTDPDSLVNYLNEDPDELQLAIAIVNAAYCNLKQIDFADADVYIDAEVYYFNDEKTGFGYEIETDIDLQ